VNENREAQALARWLEEHPGQAPPPDVDPEVIEALYALRPDLAPAPSVRIEDIFAAVGSGPFATAKDAEEEMITEEVVSLAAERAKRLPSEAAPASRPPARRAVWWSAPGIGALAAAALALVIILPTAGILLTQKTADMEAAAPPPAPATAPAEELGAKVAEPSTEAAPAPQPAPAEPPARRDASELLRQEAKKSDGMELDRDDAGALAAPADAAKPAAVAPSVDYPRSAEAAQTEAVDDLEEQTVLEKTQPEAKRKAEEAEPATESELYGAAAAAGPSASSSRRAKDVAPAAPPPAPAAVPQVIGTATLADESTTPAPYGDISAASTDAELAAATDDIDDRKAMTAALLLGRRQYERGDYDAAMATIAKGLRRTGNDDLRSDLTALQWTVAQSRPTAAPAATDQ
jgi:hypothetical protein